MISEGVELHRRVWLKRNLELVDKMEEFCKSYRLDKCGMCDIEMKQKRKCRVYSSGRCYCDVMIRARTRTFKQILSSEMALLMNIEQGNFPMEKSILRPKSF